MSDTQTKTQITTFKKPCDVVLWGELSPIEQRAFGYLHTVERRQEARFFRRHGWVYDLGEFSRVEGRENTSFAEWDGYLADSYFSSVLVRYVDDHTRVIVGQAIQRD